MVGPDSHREHPVLWMGPVALEIGLKCQGARIISHWGVRGLIVVYSQEHLILRSKPGSQIPMTSAFP